MSDRPTAIGLAILVAGLLAPPRASAAPPSVRITPMLHAPRIALAPASVSTAPDARVRAVADSIQASAEYARAAAIERRAAAARRPRRVALSAAQQDALDGLRSAAIGPVEVVLRPDTGTPRLIRGAGLERAARARAGRDRASDTARAFLRKRKALLRLEDPDRELVLERRVRDRLGRTQLRFGQRHAGLRVWPAERIVHLDPIGDVDSVDGASVATPRGVATEPAISSAQAIAAARAHITGAAAAIDPPELLYYTGSGAAQLAWRVFVPASLRARWWVLVDAGSGAVVNAWNSVPDADFAGTGINGQGFPRDLRVWQESPGNFFLADTSKPMFQPPPFSNPPDPDTTFGGIVVLDARNQPPTNDPQSFPSLFHITSTTGASPWTSGSGGNVGDGVSALSNLALTWDYFSQVHSRNSLDGNGGSLLAVVRLGQNFQNAFFLAENNIMAFGDADEYASALDVVAHELSHGVTHHSANLIYQNESGALNEAFSDIFGEMVQARVAAAPFPDWLVGSALGAPIRDMEDPPAFGDPKLYSQFVRTSADSGGVHTNSGILNHCFYQLVQGLPNAIGRQKAEGIFYRALTVHLTASAQYIDARLAAVQAALEIQTEGNLTAAEVQAVRDAFDLVQVFDGPGTDPPGDFDGTNGVDNTLFLYFDPGNSDVTLWRQEDALGDPIDGDLISEDLLRPSRPAVSGDGTLALYVDADETLCRLPTDASLAADCDVSLGRVSSVSISPDGNLIGYVLIDESTGDPDNRINIKDLRKPVGQDITSITVKAPAIDGSTIDTILFADAMDISADNRLVVFDALTRVEFTGAGAGSEIRVWAIYAVDLSTLTIFTIVPPTPGFDIGYPALAQTSDNHLTFDVVDLDDDRGTVFAGNLDTGDLEVVASGLTLFGIPSYTGDDAGIIFTDFDQDASSATSLFVQPMAPDRITPTGATGLWIFDGDYGVVYRRGTFVPEPGAAALGLAVVAALRMAARRRRR